MDQRRYRSASPGVTFSAAGLAVAYAQKEPVLLLVSTLSALAFWATEGAWKAWQKAFYKRIEDIEDYFAGKNKDAVPLQIARTWEASFDKYWLVHRKPLLKPNVLVPHVVVAAAGLLLYFWGPRG